MSRPKRTYDISIVGVKLTLVKGEDDDLITLFDQVPRRLRAITVKSALRGHALQPSLAHVPAAQVDITDELDGFIL